MRTTPLPMRTALPWAAAFTILIQGCAPSGTQELNTASTLYQQGQYARAADEYRNAIKANPSWAPPYLGLGNALAALREYDEAIYAYREAVKLKPEWAQAHLSLGQCQGEANRWADAVVSLERATALERKKGPARVALGIALTRANRWTEAVAVFKTAEAECPECLDQEAKRVYAEARRAARRQ